MEKYKVIRYAPTVIVVNEISDVTIDKIDMSRFKNLQVEKTPGKNEITITLTRLDLQAWFSTLLDELEQTLNKFDRPLAEVINRFIHFVKQIGSRERVKDQKMLALGLYGEFCTLEKLFVNGTRSKREYLDAWRRPSLTIYDFVLDGDEGNIETKVVSRSASAFDVSSEYQLSNSSDPLKLWIHKVEISDSEYDSVAEKYNGIIEMLRNEPDGEELSETFRIKSLESVKGRCYEGPIGLLLKFKIDLVNSEIFEVNHDFPRLVNLPNGVHTVKYKVDLSAIAKYKIKSYG